MSAMALGTGGQGTSSKMRLTERCVQHEERPPFLKRDLARARRYNTVAHQISIANFGAIKQKPLHGTRYKYKDAKIQCICQAKLRYFSAVWDWSRCHVGLDVLRCVGGASCWNLDVGRMLHDELPLRT